MAYTSGMVLYGTDASGNAQKVAVYNEQNYKNYLSSGFSEQAPTTTKVTTPTTSVYNPQGNLSVANLSAKTTPAPAVYSSAAASKDVVNNQATLSKAEEAITNYSQLTNKGGTIYNASGKGYATPEELAKDMGTTADKIDWTKIGTNTPIISKTGNVALDTKVDQINQTLSQPYTGTVIDAYNARPDVQAEIARSFPGEDPFKAGSPANTWLNDWWNSTGKNEMAQAQTQNVNNVKDAEEAITTAVANARLAENGGDLLAFRESIKALEEAQTARQTAIDKLYEEQKTMRQQYLTSLMPTTAETDLQTQIADLSQQIKQTELNEEAGIAKVNSQTIPQAFLTGQNAAIQKQATTALNTLNNSYNNLVTRLGLAQSSRQATTSALGAGLDFLTSDIKTQQDAQDKLYNEEQDLISRFDAYTAQQKEEVANVLEALSGVDPSSLSVTAKNKIATLAVDLGIDVTDLMQSLQNQYDQAVMASIADATADTTIIETGGRQLLINKSTGETIKDLGAVQKSSSGSGSSTTSTATKAKTAARDYAATLIEKLDTGKIQWATAWQQMKVKYGEYLTDSEIDELLGGNGTTGEGRAKTGYYEELSGKGSSGSNTSKSNIITKEAIEAALNSD